MVATATIVVAIAMVVVIATVVSHVGTVFTIE